MTTETRSDGPQSVSETWYRIVFIMGNGRLTRYVTGVTDLGETFEAFDHTGHHREWSKTTPFLKTQLGGRDELPPKIREELEE